ncbi:uncharacterized protein LOC135137459 [Zophobas morio]|uniref:uncharacterized protein LOC135137459 n=1 Tax=Zophobas morio TaxID=2755281 RepID=UPI003083CDAE
MLSLQFSSLILATTIISSSCTISRCRSWLDDPCTTEIRPNYRIKRASYVTLVKNQVQILISRFRLYSEKIMRLYKDAAQSGQNSTKARLNIRDLNVKKMLNKMTKDPDHRLEEFLYGLQLFAHTVEKLKNITVDSEDNFLLNSKRDEIYSSMIYQMRSLLCEVQYSLHVTKGVVTIAGSSHAMKIHLPSNAVLDLGSAYVLDKKFFKKTIHFLVKASRILSPSNLGRFKGKLKD